MTSFPTIQLIQTIAGYSNDLLENRVQFYHDKGSIHNPCGFNIALGKQQELIHNELLPKLNDELSQAEAADQQKNYFEETYRKLWTVGYQFDVQIRGLIVRHFESIEMKARGAPRRRRSLLHLYPQHL